MMFEEQGGKTLSTQNGGTQKFERTTQDFPQIEGEEEVRKLARQILEEEKRKERDYQLAKCLEEEEQKQRYCNYKGNNPNPHHQNNNNFIHRHSKDSSCKNNCTFSSIFHGDGFEFCVLSILILLIAYIIWCC